MIITLLRNELSFRAHLSEDMLLCDALCCLGAESEYVLWDDPGYDWSRPDLVLIRELPRQGVLQQSFLCWATAVSQTTPLWPSVPLLAALPGTDALRAGEQRTWDGTAARRSLIFVDDLLVHAVEQPAMQQAEQDGRVVVATREERAIAFAALQQALKGESCLMARVDVRQHPAGEVMLDSIHLIDAHLSLAISPLAVHSLAQGCLRLAQQAHTHRGGEGPHTVSLARQASFALRYRCRWSHERALQRGRAIPMSFSSLEKGQ